MAKVGPDKPIGNQVIRLCWLGFWAVRPEFTCILRHDSKSNREGSRDQVVLDRSFIEILLLILLFFILSGFLNTFIVWGCAGGGIGYFGGWFGVKHFMVFQPIRRKSNCRTG